MPSYRLPGPLSETARSALLRIAHCALLAFAMLAVASGSSGGASASGIFAAATPSLSDGALIATLWEVDSDFHIQQLDTYTYREPAG
jgi:hypothetical protein